MAYKNKIIKKQKFVRYHTFESIQIKKENMSKTIFSDFSSDDFNSSDESIFSDASESDDEHIHDTIKGTRRIFQYFIGGTS